MPGSADIDALLTMANVSRETIDKLALFESLLKKWNPSINLVSKSTLDSIWSRHILDSAQMWPLTPKTTEKWVDMGSGAGFPGLVLAIIAAELQPDMQFTLIESDLRKCTYLSTVARAVDIAVNVRSERAEILAPEGANVISARALAALPKLLEYATHHAAEDAICLFHKGKSYESELTEARKYWKFDLQITPSNSEPGGAILRIENFERT